MRATGQRRTQRQWLKWFCEGRGGGSPDEARLEQTPYHSNPTNLALFGHKITLYRFNQGARTIAGGSKGSRGAEPPHFNRWTKRYKWINTIQKFAFSEMFV